MAKKKKANIIINVFGYILLAILTVVLVIVAVCKFQGKTPSLFGYRLYTIISPSMEPELKVSDIILSKNAEADKLKVGDTVTYMGEVGDHKGKLITHKIVEIYEQDGILYVITKGVANPANDPRIEASKIISVMDSKLGAMTGIYKFISTPYGFIIVIVLPLSAVLFWEIRALLKNKNKKAAAGISEGDNGNIDDESNNMGDTDSVSNTDNADSNVNIDAATDADSANNKDSK